MAEKKVRSQLLDITLMARRLILCMKIIGVRKDDVVFIFKNFYVRWLLWLIQNRRYDASISWDIFRNWLDTGYSISK